MYVNELLRVSDCEGLCSFSPQRQWGQIRVNPLFQTPCGCSPPCCHQSQLDGQSCPLSFILTHEHTCSQVQEPVRAAGAEVGKPPLFRDDKHLCKPSKQPLSFSLSFQAQCLHHPHHSSNHCLSNAPKDFHPGLNAGQEQTRDSSLQEVGTDQSTTRFFQV